MRRPQIRRAALLVVTATLAWGAAAEAQPSFVMTERFVPHPSTVPATAGERVGLYLRERVTEASGARFEGGAAPEGRVVLFVHGGSVSSIPDYDLPERSASENCCAPRNRPRPLALAVEAH